MTESSRLSRSEWAARREQLRRDRRRSHGFGRLWGWLAGRPRWERVAIVASAAVVATVVLFVVVDVAASAGRVHPGVTVSGIGVGGMTAERARDTLEREMGERLARPVTASYEDLTWSVEASEVAAVPDTEAMLTSAMRVGRSGPLGERVVERARAWLGGIDLAPVVNADAELVDSIVTAIEDKVGRDPVDASVVIEDLEARVEPAEPGLAVTHDALVDALLVALASERREVEVGVEVVPVQVTDDEAEQARTVAERMMSDGVRVTYEERVWEFSRADIARWIDFRKVPAAESTVTTGRGASGSSSESAAAEDSGGGGATASSGSTATTVGPEMVLQAFISADEASATITRAVGEAGRPAKNAEFKVHAGTVTIVPSQDGVGPDIEALAKEMTRVLAGTGPREVELRTTRVEPDITTDDAKKMGIKERISTYTTTYDPTNTPRVNNIHTLADALDGTLVPPGGVFSFNETVGPRTAEKGYQEAPAIVNGKLVPQLGGGICQVGTTIFNAVFESGLPVVERRNHSFYISHYPKGRDATVSWGGPDFKFKNDTEHWILVATGYSNSSLTISLYGTDPGYEVSQVVGPWTNVKPHPVEEIEDDSMPLGSRVVEDGGVDGRTIVVTRIVTKDGVEVRRDTFTSVYKPKTEVVRIGTKKPSKATTQTATP